MNQDRIIKAYECARDEYAEYGIDTDKALEQFDEISMSLHCWQGDDVVGLEGLGDVESQNLVTGCYPYAAKTGDELRSDIRMAFSLSPFKHKVNLHSMYAERKNPRNDLTIEDFRNWVDFAKEHGYGLDYNASFFTHPMMNNGFSLACLDKSTRDYWIEAGIDSREISLAMGKELGQKCFNNIWIPDGLKDIPVNRYRYRELLIDSLDKILGTPYTEEEHQYAADVLEGKVFGIGTESFVVGSHEFYLGYAATHNCGVTLDTGHFNPTENIPDKLSAYRPFVRDLMLHISRGIHWDSDHVLIQDDHLMTIMHEMRMGNLYGDVAMGLDFFDASINRVACWSIGLRAAAKAVLASHLEPVNLTDPAEVAGDFTSRLMLIDEAKNLPVNAVWEYMLMKKNIAIGQDALKAIKTYEKDVMATR